MFELVETLGVTRDVANMIIDGVGVGMSVASVISLILVPFGFGAISYGAVRFAMWMVSRITSVWGRGAVALW